MSSCSKQDNVQQVQGRMSVHYSSASSHLQAAIFSKPDTISRLLVLDNFCQTVMWTDRGKRLNILIFITLLII